MKHPELPEYHSCHRMTAKPAVWELLYLHLPAEYSAVHPAGQADTVHCPAVYSAELPAGQADTVRCPAVYSVRTAEVSPAEHSADRKADKGCTEVLPQVRPHLL